MFGRTVSAAIERSLEQRAATLVTGARRVGKTALCRELASKRGFGYVSLASERDRSEASADPEAFLRSRGTPLIIDEIQYAPFLFDYIEAVVDRALFETDFNKGMYLLIGSRDYNLMKGVTQSMAGRIGIIKMSPLSLSEIHSREEVPFRIDLEKNSARGAELELSVGEMYEAIVRGMYPDLHADEGIDAGAFYSGYAREYVERDLPQHLKVRDGARFARFMRHMASLTGRELSYGGIARELGMDARTVESWVGALAANGLVHLLRAHPLASASKRPKIYFSDTGLACHLAGVKDAGSLMESALRRQMEETFIVNEILKSYQNNRENAGFYHYSGPRGDAVELMIFQNGRMSLIGCGSARGALCRPPEAGFEIGASCAICMIEKPRLLSDGSYALPPTSI
ncbi:MAG: AAA family ATPase [Candidatus Methanoplasma sp.]|nr:AAA family ATPase [Candidatus Methanoplasma sp.]